MFFRRPKNNNLENNEHCIIILSKAQWEQAINKYQLRNGFNIPVYSNNEILFQLLYHEFTSVILAESADTSPDGNYRIYSRASERDIPEYRVIAEFSMSKEALSQLFNKTLVVHDSVIIDSDVIRKQYNNHLIKLVTDTKNQQTQKWEKYRDLYVRQSRCTIM